MKRATTIRTQPKAFPEPILDQRIDSILAAEDELLPSSGFLASVMEQVEQEAALPPRLPSPGNASSPAFSLPLPPSPMAAINLRVWAHRHCPRPAAAARVASARRRRLAYRTGRLDCSGIGADAAQLAPLAPPRWPGRAAVTCRFGPTSQSRKPFQR